MRTHKINLPLNASSFAGLIPGDKVLLSGVVFTARDQAHARFVEILDRGEALPLDLEAIFYCGPSPAPPGRICGAIGPTTSCRMDRYTKPLLERGMKLMIGKGERSPKIEAAIRAHGALYLVCVGGIAALLAQHVVACETWLWPELGPEAVYRLELKDLPCYVAVV